MDNLAKNAMLAREAGMSYGKWKAMQAPVEVRKMPEPDTIKCPECGAAFVRERPKQKYCSYRCQNRRSARRCRQKKKEISCG